MTRKTKQKRQLIVHGHCFSTGNCMTNTSEMFKGALQSILKFVFFQYLFPYTTSYIPKKGGGEMDMSSLAIVGATGFFEMILASKEHWPAPRKRMPLRAICCGRGKLLVHNTGLNRQCFVSSIRFRSFVEELQAKTGRGVLYVNTMSQPSGPSLCGHGIAKCFERCRSSAYKSFSFQLINQIKTVDAKNLWHFLL